jgi:Brp/Blh family beta-carotene 15,15'-monooxygenase
MTAAAAVAPRAVFLAVAAATVAAMVVWSPSHAAQLALLAPLVAVLGVPHGALDVHVASRLWPLRRPCARLGFGLGYLAVAAAVLGLWVVAPAVALGAFLLYSALHFAGDWRDELPPAARLAAGVAVVTLPAWRFEAEVGAIFAALGAADAAPLIAGAMHALQPWVALAAIAAAVARRRAGTTVELVGLTALAAAAPPLVYFAVYFCGLHSLRHFVATLAQLGLAARAGIAAAVPLSALTLVFAGGAAALLLARGIALEAAALEIVFIGLAALAVPHMVLVERFWTRREA